MNEKRYIGIGEKVQETRFNTGMHDMCTCAIGVLQYRLDAKCNERSLLLRLHLQLYVFACSGERICMISRARLHVQSNMFAWSKQTHASKVNAFA